MTTPSHWAAAAVSHVEKRSSGDPLDPSHRITLNFHPDRLADGVHILDSMLSTGEYRSQYQTRSSNGGLTAHPGGDRWLWEQSLFGGAYDDAPLAERPKYGALDHLRRPLGGAPRFGSAYMLLREHMLSRATFCFPDSSFSPSHFATARRFALLPVPSLEHVVDDDPARDPLDGYIEAHVHGRISLAEDVESLVLDPSFASTDTHLQAERLGLPLTWHEGRVVHIERLAELEEYRGPDPIRVGRRVAEDGWVDARVIGKAVLRGEDHPQHLKQLWHLTAQWGMPSATRGG